VAEITSKKKVARKWFVGGEFFGNKVSEKKEGIDEKS